jgi:hypothetical protein
VSRSDAERLEDIRAAISRCIAYRDRLDSVELGPMAYDAILRNLAVIGEAVKSLPDTTTRRPRLSDTGRPLWDRAPIAGGVAHSAECAEHASLLAN